MPKLMAVIRVRGSSGIPPKVRSTLAMLNLCAVNNCALVDDRPSYKGMLKLCKDYITWGEINGQTLMKLMVKKGGIDEKKAEELAKKLLNLEIKTEECSLPAVFRLHPPRRGYKHVKKAFPHGALGYRGEKVNELIMRML
ncbi:MAG: 50S ribosomal protein L30 [Candidatus Micrarchaeia archaeon]